MATGIRGTPPIWVMRDLVGNPLDDTYFLFVLENTLPYIPTPVYHDPDLNIPWTNPIRFLPNGTLPDNIYYPDGVYRLEIRQGNTQNAALIYPIENYVPGESSNTPSDNAAVASTNQITNPQFALISFSSPFSLSATNPDPVSIGAGWLLNLSGTGTATITQVPLNNANANPTNAPYALKLVLSGWTEGAVFLTQRFEQNGMLWANKYVASSITARIQGAPQEITATLVDSNGDTLGTVLPPTNLDQAFNEYTGVSLLPPTINPNVPPSAYIDYKLAIPSNVEIYLTSFQVTVQDTPVATNYIQDSVNRQIDHTYHNAHPILPIGTIIPFNGFDVPAHYLFCGSQALSRQTYSLLFNAVTKVETVNLTSGLTTFTASSNTASQLRIGAPLEGVGISGGTLISNVAGTTVTMSAIATATTASAVRFFLNGNGDGSTTFNAPGNAGMAIAGSGGSLFAGARNGVGATGGAATVSLASTNLPAHQHNYLYPTIILGFAAGGIAGLAFAGQQFTTTGGPTDPPTPISIVSPTYLAKYCIRYE